MGVVEEGVVGWGGRGTVKTDPGLSDWVLRDLGRRGDGGGEGGKKERREGRGRVVSFECHVLVRDLSSGV